MSRVVIQSPASELTETQQCALNSLPPRVAEALSHFRDALLARFGDQVRRIILYGSFARGEAHTESDDAEAFIAKARELVEAELSRRGGALP